MRFCSLGASRATPAFAVTATIAAIIAMCAAVETMEPPTRELFLGLDSSRLSNIVGLRSRDMQYSRATVRPLHYTLVGTR